MDTLSVELDNCFGIGKFKHTFEFNKDNTVIIYAPNGTMKSSFAGSFDALSKGTIPKDRVYARDTVCTVKADKKKIDSANILVVNTEERIDGSSKIGSFIARKELQKQYAQIYEKLDENKTEFIKKLKKTSQSNDCEREFMNTFGDAEGKQNFFELLDSLIAALSEKVVTYSFKYNDVFDKKDVEGENGIVRKFLSQNPTVLDDYINNYRSLLSKSTIFKQSGNSFGTYQASVLANSVKDNAFFEAGHKMMFDGGREVKSVDEFQQYLEAEIEKIIHDKTLKASFDKIDKAITGNKELRDFQRVIREDNLLLTELKDYDGFKQKVWLGYFKDIKQECEELSAFYTRQKAELACIIEEAKKDIKLWFDIIETFNSRFFVPFKVRLKNQEDVILKKHIANLEFDYQDHKNEKPVTHDKDGLFVVLSKGEQRAYNILQLLFEIESRKQNKEKCLIVFDDVADSFDYKNKYAIIEYIRDLRQANFFRMIILTHNFDFYRTVCSRLRLAKTSKYFAFKNEDRHIQMNAGQSINVFEAFIKRVQEPKMFISLIPFVRNLIEYSDVSTCAHYMLLTQCLHLKKETIHVTATDVFDLFRNRLKAIESKEISFGEEKILELIFRCAGEIKADANETDLENKIVLSIAIRLKAEQYMFASLGDEQIGELSGGYQTRQLFDCFSTAYPGCDEVKVLDKVNLMTPENIHLNSFMYEPLIDMSVHHLRVLYTDILLLGVKKLSLEFDTAVPSSVPRDSITGIE